MFHCAYRWVRKLAFDLNPIHERAQRISGVYRGLWQYNHTGVTTKVTAAG